MGWTLWALIFGLSLFTFSIFPPSIHYLRSTLSGKKIAKPDSGVYQPKVTIFLPTRNESSNIERKIDEILSMDYPLSKINVLVIDSCSSDDTVQLASNYLSLSNSVCGWEVFSLEKAGKSIAVNQALDKIETEFFVMMDSDAICKPDSLKLLLSWFSDRKIGAVCGQHLIEKGKSGFHYRSSFNIIRIGESYLDSTPIFEGSVCAFRKSALLGKKINERINADDSQLAMLVRRNGFKSMMDSRVLFREKNTIDSRKRRVRRAQGLIRALFSNRDLCSDHGIFSRIMLQSIYFHTIFPWAILSSILITSLPILFNPDFVLSLSYVTITAFLFVSSIIASRFGRGLVIGSTILIEAQIRLLFGETLESWIPERDQGKLSQ